MNNMCVHSTQKHFLMSDCSQALIRKLKSNITLVINVRFKECKLHVARFVGRGNLVRQWKTHLRFRSQGCDLTGFIKEIIVVLSLRSAFIRRSFTVCTFRALTLISCYWGNTLRSMKTFLLNENFFLKVEKEYVIIS